MKRFKDFLGNEITDPRFLKILQRLDQFKKRNKGHKNFSGITENAKRNQIILVK